MFVLVSDVIEWVFEITGGKKNWAICNNISI